MGVRSPIQLYDGLSVEVLALMIANQGYWESFDFIYIDGSPHGGECLDGCGDELGRF